MCGGVFKQSNMMDERTDTRTNAWILNMHLNLVCWFDNSGTICLRAGVKKKTSFFWRTQAAQVNQRQVHEIHNILSTKIIVSFYRCLANDLIANSINSINSIASVSFSYFLVLFMPTVWWLTPLTGTVHEGAVGQFDENINDFWAQWIHITRMNRKLTKTLKKQKLLVLDELYELVWCLPCVERAASLNSAMLLERLERLEQIKQASFGWFTASKKTKPQYRTMWFDAMLFVVVHFRLEWFSVQFRFSSNFLSYWWLDWFPNHWNIE